MASENRVAGTSMARSYDPPQELQLADSLGAHGIREQDGQHLNGRTVF